MAYGGIENPSFYRGEVIRNPNWRDRLGARVRESVIALFQPA